MISHIGIWNFALIDHVSVDFNRGLNIITGETGAGKSIIIEAISLALGSRADTTYIRTGKEKATVQIIFDEINSYAVDFLEENGIVLDEDLIITREITSAGKSICRINGQIVSVSVLNKLCKYLADIHGQYDHQSLLNPDNHIDFIDLYGSEKIYPFKDSVSSIYKDYNNKKVQLSKLLQYENENLRNKDFMEFQLDEIVKSQLLIGEDASLNEEIHILQNGEKIFNNLEESYSLLYESSPSALTELKQIIDLLNGVSHYSSEIEINKDIILDCFYKLQEVSTDIRRFKDGISFDREILDSHILRLDNIENLKRKYGGSIEAVLEYKDTLESKLSIISDSSMNKEILEREIIILENRLIEESKSLSKLRKSISIELEEKINYQLKELNFKNSNIRVNFNEKNPDENGIDNIEFLISTNIGEPEKPLVKIASGGEISRIMLAIKSIISNLDSVPTLIFDEIDSGISGITASIVGKKLLQISNNQQVICITHLPQIAAYGSQNYMIEKHSENNSTSTNIVPLDKESKILEIARLTGGITLTEASIANARELVELSLEKQK